MTNFPVLTNKFINFIALNKCTQHAINQTPFFYEISYFSGNAH